MDISVTPASLSGRLKMPPSKSAAHRAAICAALAAGISALSPVEATADMLATVGAVRALGAKAELEGDTLTITGVERPPSSAVIDCGESGSTLRFMLPVAAALGVSSSFRGHGRLPLRPMGELSEAIDRHGVTISKKDGEIISCSGRLRPGLYEIGGGVSSQYITGLLLALSLLDGDSELALTSPLESAGYVDMTVDMLRRFGVKVAVGHGRWKIPGGQRYKAQSLDIEADYSSAAFWFCAAALGGRVEALGLNPASVQGDRRVLELVAGAGAEVSYGRESITVLHQTLKGFDLDVAQIPDLTPALAALAAFCNGTSTLYNARRLRLKESDRIAAIASGLKAMGAGVVEGSDRLVIIGQPQLRGGARVDSCGDHRIAMAMSIAASYCRDASVITGAECINKSYPGFYRDFAALGGICDVL